MQSSVYAKINHFFFETKVSLRYEKEAIAIYCLLNFLFLFPDYSSIISRNGIIEGSLNGLFSNSQLTPFALNFMEVKEDIFLLLFWGVYAISLLMILFRIKALLFSIIAWLFHLMIVNASYFFSYGADYFITFILFVNMLFHLSSYFPYLKSFTIRLVQIHLCIVYFFAGFGKALGVDWLNGNAIWYVLNNFSQDFVFNIVDYGMKEICSYLFHMISIAVVVIEIFYPLFMYHNVKSKKIELLFIVLLHVGIIIFLHFYTFGSLLILLNLIAWTEVTKNKQMKII
ncbi:hypothetical protein MWN41_11410 [Ornithobacterium rhinotracheale]|uniref:hypothetical protein n=1 Tax=Ornithobacterium rhinotracheale TaxID=28251 RepID=UPI001FF5BAFE|nr:hypothetical protein [Ornithobacterium rhinotracheale]MCK0203622.1 hypothetical protein [Ornithobacterium rhinotracheale]